MGLFKDNFMCPWVAKQRSFLKWWYTETDGFFENPATTMDDVLCIVPFFSVEIKQQQEALGGVDLSKFATTILVETIRQH